MNIQLIQTSVEQDVVYIMAMEPHMVESVSIQDDRTVMVQFDEGPLVRVGKAEKAMPEGHRVHSWKISGGEKEWRNGPLDKLSQLSVTLLTVTEVIHDREEAPETAAT